MTMATCNQSHSKKASSFELDDETTDADNPPISNIQRYNNIQLANLVKKGIGSRTITKFAKECKLSSSFLSRLTNNSLVSQPSKNSLIKIAEAGLENNITIVDLMIAAGYIATNKSTISNNLQPHISPYILPQNYSLIPTFALSLLLNVLVYQNKIGEDEDIEILQKPGFFEICYENKAKKIIGFPAICNVQDVDHTMNLLARSILLLEYMNKEQSDTENYFVVTNQEKIFDEIDNIVHLSPNSKLKLNIVLTKNYYSFSKQRRIPDMNTQSPNLPEEHDLFWLVPQEG